MGEEALKLNGGHSTAVAKSSSSLHLDFFTVRSIWRSALSEQVRVYRWSSAEKQWGKAVEDFKIKHIQSEP